MGLEDLLVESARRLGVAADRMWPQLVAITFYRSLFWLILDPVVVVGGLFALLRSVPRLITGCKQDDAGIYLPALAILLVAGSLLITVTITMADHIGGVVAPEAQMIREFVGGLRR